MNGASIGEPFTVVGIYTSSASADEAIALLKEIPAISGMAFVLLYAGLETEVLKEALCLGNLMPVLEVTDEASLLVNHLYLVPLKREVIFDKMTLRQGIVLDELEKGLGINLFFKSLAGLRENAVGVVISYDSDEGKSGLDAILLKGGNTFTFLGGGKFSHSSPVALNNPVELENVPELFTEIFQCQTSSPISPYDESPDEKNQLAKGRILDLLRHQSGVDFSQYKGSTVHRRLIRRMILSKSANLSAYAELLENKPGELNTLYSDLFINVTRFFRSADAFEVLKTYTFNALKSHSAQEKFRVWVAGCSTGQEVYSLAMSLLEASDALSKGHQFQFFATDVDEDALEIARNGVYSENLLADVSAERRARFFVKVDAGYRISQTIRDMVVFARHNLIGDPPFSNMDLVSCRNLLIYLDDALQRKMILLFHYSLRPGGILFLGSAESVGTSTELFEFTDKKNKIFTKRAVPTPALPIKQSVVPPHVGHSLHQAEISMPVVPLILSVQREADRVALLRYAPSGVLISDQMQILQFRGDTSAFLRPPIGTATAAMNLLKMARPGLIRPLKEAFEQAHETRRTVRVESIPVHHNEGSITVDLEIVPLRNLRETSYLVSFEQSNVASAKTVLMDVPANERFMELERELAEAQDEVQAHLENYEAAIEELQASNEEVKAAYEELQSINEELESTNEELTTVNEEIANRNAELSRLINDLNNLHLNIDTGIMLLGRDLTIRSFTPLAGKTFNLLPSDIGSPLNRIRHPIQSVELEEGISQVIEEQTVREFELQDAEGHWYALRVRPYKTIEGGTDGAVLVMVDIDKHLEAVRLSETRYRRLFEATKDGILLIDSVSRKIIDANPFISDLLGLDRDNVIGHEFWQIGLLEDQMTSDDVLSQILTHGFYRADNLQINTQNGIRILEMISNLYAEDEHSVIQCNIRDVTDRKAGEEAGRRLAAIVDSSQDAIISKDLNGIITSWNGSAVDLLGYTAEEMIGQSVTRIIPPERISEETIILSRIQRGELLDHFDTERLRKDGRLINVSLTVSPIRASDGTIIGASKIARDITDRILAEAALRESEARFRTVADAAPVLIWVADDSKKCLYFNKAWLTFTGRSAEDENGFGWTDGIHPDDYDRCLKAYVTAFEERKPFEREYRLRDHQGEYRWLYDRGIPRMSPEGFFEGYIGACVDVHDQKQSAKAIHKAKEAMVQASRAKDHFLATLSHELRTPLSPVLTISAARSEDQSLSASVREDFAMIRKNVELEARLIDDLLDLTRITEGKIALNLEVIDLHALVYDTVAIFKSDIDAKNLHLILELSSTPLMVNADTTRLLQVLWNVVKNAVKFSPTGGRLIVRSYRELDRARLVIADQGIGITEAEMPNIFDAFAQGQEASGARFGGLGLGLAISSLLVAEHHGKIWAESEGRNQGATFYIEVPLTLQKEVKDQPVVESKSPAKGIRILLVEDHEDTRRTFVRLLEQRGHIVFTASCLAQARVIAQTENLDLLISDLGLPDGSGHELMFELKHRYDLPGIALSGYGMSGDIERSLEAGFVEHLTKPIDMARLNQSILGIFVPQSEVVD